MWGTKESLEEYEKFCKELMDKWENEFWWPNREELWNKMVEEDRKKREVLDVEKREYDLIPCTCGCHNDPNVMHIIACCDNGYRKIRRAPKNELNDFVDGAVDEWNRIWKDTPFKAVKKEDAPNHTSTDPHQWMTEKEIYEEKFRANSPHCSYCDYTPCRCSKEKE
jgi:hypothetical protein